jgi:hypothetical protein
VLPPQAADITNAMKATTDEPHLLCDLQRCSGPRA